LSGFGIRDSGFETESVTASFSNPESRIPNPEMVYLVTQTL